MTSSVLLKPDRLLIDSNFESYKLSLENVPVKKVELEHESRVFNRLPSAEQYSFLCMKMFANHNHLHGDPWDPDSAYFFGQSGEIFATRDEANKTLVQSGPRPIWQLPASDDEIAEGRFNPSLVFAGPDLAVVSDGRGAFHIAHTGDRTIGDEWEVAFSGEVCGKDRSFVVADAIVSEPSKDRLRLDCLLQYVEEREMVEGFPAVEGDEGAFVTVVEWFTFDSTRPDRGKYAWNLERIRKVGGKCTFNYTSLDRNASGLVLLTDREVYFFYDSMGPSSSDLEVDVIGSDGTLNNSNEKMDEKICWSQEIEDVTIRCHLPADTKKSDITVDFKPRYLSIKCRDKVIFGNSLKQAVDTDGCTWTISGQSLELVLPKADAGLVWSQLTEGSGDPENIAQVSDVGEVEFGVGGEEGRISFPASNVEQLEECDELEVEGRGRLVRIDGERGVVVDEVNVDGNAFLFEGSCRAASPAEICLRHDVDGLVWRRSEPGADGRMDWKHVDTFSALGYVQASKTQKKFISASADGSYAAICDVTRHVYLYRKPQTLVNSSLRNRKSGKTVEHVAKQHVISLDPPEDIFGVYASNKTLIVLTENNLFFVQVN